MRVSILALFAAILSTQSYAADFQLTGTTKQVIKTKNTLKAKSFALQARPKVVKLLSFHLSPKAHRLLNLRLQKRVDNLQASRASKLPSQVQLGMNGVPVLDQGNHGTCATFANAAGIDSFLRKDRYMSELCLLQLGNHLEENGYVSSGWDGSLGRFVLARLDQNGFMTRTKEREIGCGGLNEYPATGEQPSTFIGLEDYHNYSRSLEDEGIYWSPLLDVFKMVEEQPNMNQVVRDIKAALKGGARVSFGVIFPGVEEGVAGAVGMHHQPNDSWILTTDLISKLRYEDRFPGHEMLITGYDDKAEAVDADGQVHRGLFTLRNSWGEAAGDNGDFYMSYDYFKVLALEAQQIKKFDGDSEDDFEAK